ncbi:MAG TPA: alpha/beta hydrolase [Cytophagales bacterium]|nr:alpha/beta hydrolase [Cytophagales bacterium]
MTLPELSFHYSWVPANPKSDKTLLLHHGTGGNENDLLDLGKLVAPNFNLLSVRGKVSEDGLNRFFKRKSIGVFDVEDLKFRSIELGQFIRNAKKKLEIEEDQIVALGYSNGANIATGVVFHDPKLLSGAVLSRPMVPYQPEKIDLQKIKILLISGIMDTTMSPEEPERLERIYRENNGIVTAHALSMSHGLSTEDIRIVQEWVMNNFD